jgi:hypothetical protein
VKVHKQVTKGFDLQALSTLLKPTLTYAYKHSHLRSQVETNTLLNEKTSQIETRSSLVPDQAYYPFSQALLLETLFIWAFSK